MITSPPSPMLYGICNWLNPNPLPLLHDKSNLHPLIGIIGITPTQGTIQSSILQWQGLIFFPLVWQFVFHNNFFYLQCFWPDKFLTNNVLATELFCFEICFTILTLPLVILAYKFILVIIFTGQNFSAKRIFTDQIFGLTNYSWIIKSFCTQILLAQQNLWLDKFWIPNFCSLTRLLSLNCFKHFFALKNR